MTSHHVNLPPKPKPPPVNAYCPKCGSAMRFVEVGRGQTFEPFYGCIDYPGCNGKRGVMSTGEAMLTDDELLRWIYD